jgi:hypothetical protein
MRPIPSEPQVACAGECAQSVVAYCVGGARVHAGLTLVHVCTQARNASGAETACAMHESPTSICQARKHDEAHGQTAMILSVKEPALCHGRGHDHQVTMTKQEVHAAHANARPHIYIYMYIYVYVCINMYAYAWLGQTRAHRSSLAPFQENRGNIRSKRKNPLC